MKKAVLITGAAGGIGTALSNAYQNAGWFVIGTSRKTPENIDELNAFIACDLLMLASDDLARDEFVNAVLEVLYTNKAELHSLVNNAALQVLGGADDLTAKQFENSFAVNTLAPFRLTQAFLTNLETTKGSVVNIGTVHAQSTKKGFVAYATTKTAMHGLTRALAVDLGGRVRVNCLAPAATATPMLMAGFAGREQSFEKLAESHPIGRVANPAEVAKAAVFLSSNDASFITGSTLYCDGGVLSRLHDPE
ncbi:MAG: SDR family oxidoreductase [Acidimicrobiales bacterium]|nr:SDR family oxidoreductase [Hyphomonadaceae bacterium]RZV41188.1 MAG: SDR family oxidoreductase [Acidimicrobiales bacterium]